VNTAAVTLLSGIGIPALALVVVWLQFRRSARADRRAGDQGLVIASAALQERYESLLTRADTEAAEAQALIAAQAVLITELTEQITREHHD